MFHFAFNVIFAHQSVCQQVHFGKQRATIDFGLKAVEAVAQPKKLFCTAVVVSGMHLWSQLNTIKAI